MVVHELGGEDLDRLFRALADGTRRDIVARVIVGEQSVSGLASHYAMSFAAVQKHVAILERAALVTKEKRGREQIVRVRLESITHAREVLGEFEAIWRQRVDRIDHLLATD